MKDLPIKISVIVITWNELDLVDRCLHSFYDKFDFNSHEIVVVDNGSSDGTGDMILEKYPSVTYVKLRRNIGVGPARNRGIIASRGEFIMTLDNDALLECDFSTVAASIESSFESEERLGVMGFRLCYPDGTYQYNGRSFPGLLQPFVSRVAALQKVGVLGRLIDKHLRKDLGNESSGLHEVDYVLGANQIYRKKDVIQIGMYDDAIFFGPEDLEFCWRLKESLGRVNMINLSLSIVHDYQRRTTKINLILLKHLVSYYSTWVKMRLARF